MYKVELSEQQAKFLVEMLLDHAEWADVLSKDDRVLFSVVDAIEYQLPNLFDEIVEEKLSYRAEAEKKMLEERKNATK